MTTPELVQAQRAYFETGATRSAEFRLASLKKLQAAVQANERALAEAMAADFRKAPMEVYMTETGMVLDEIRFHLKHLRAWMRETRVPTPLAQFPSRSFRSPEPYGVCLILAPWNYPIQLCLEPLIGAISGADTDPAVLEIWTVKDGAPVMLAQSHARDKYYVEYLADENAWLIANEGSGGAASSVWFYYALQNGELALMQGVTSESGAWYMTYDTDYDVSNDTPSDEAACQEIIDSHTERYTALDYTPYTELRQ